VKVALGAGLVAGALIAILTVSLEHGRIAFGAYALYGNGALIAPSLLAPFALYPVWTWTLRRGGRALELAVYVVGLHFGLGLTSPLEVVFFPSDPDLTLVDALPGLLLTGAIFVLPAALLAGFALWAVRRAPDSLIGVAVVVAVVTAALLGFVYGIGLGVLAGAAVALAERRPQGAVVIGLGLAMLVLVLGNLPYLSLLFAPTR